MQDFQQEMPDSIILSKAMNPPSEQHDDHTNSGNWRAEGEAPLAQLAEQLTLNQWVPGSSPGGCTKENGLGRRKKP